MKKNDKGVNPIRRYSIYRFASIQLRSREDWWPI